jgi:hypothetical protein
VRDRTREGEREIGEKRKREDNVSRRESVGKKNLKERG